VANVGKKIREQVKRSRNADLFMSLMHAYSAKQGTGYDARRRGVWAIVIARKYHLNPVEVADKWSSQRLHGEGFRGGKC